MAGYREIYATTDDGGVQLAASADRWYVYDDYVHLSPQHTEGDLLRWEAELKPFVDNPTRCALLITEMQNDFCAPGGWTDASGLDYGGCRKAIPGAQSAIEAARGYGMWIIWVYWHNRHDLRNLGAPTLHSFKHSPRQRPWTNRPKKLWAIADGHTPPRSSTSSLDSRRAENALLATTAYAGNSASASWRRASGSRSASTSAGACCAAPSPRMRTT